jgi:tetratricopeptide (TPR) repeat protein
VRTEHERSREARERIAEGQGARALDAYRALEQETGPLPEIAVGRGAALLGEQRAPEAAAEFARARGAAEPLGSRALLGLSDALEQTGDLDGAIAASREALTRDPALDDARHNLEVLLRRKREAGAPPKPSPEGSPQPGDGQGAGQGAPQPGGGSRAGEKPASGPRPESGSPTPGGARPGERKESGDHSGGTSRTRIGSEEARRLLDAMRAREPNLPQRPTRARGRRADVEKDW